MCGMLGTTHTELQSNHHFAYIYLFGPHSSEKQCRCTEAGRLGLELEVCLSPELLPFGFGILWGLRSYSVGGVNRKQMNVLLCLGFRLD